MIILKEREDWIDLPIFQRCYLDECGVYRLILQNNFTKEIYVFKLRDFNRYFCRQIRLHLEIKLPKEFIEGEYTYYLIPDSEWYSEDIDHNRPKQSFNQTDKEAITSADGYLLVGDTLIVTGRFKARLVDSEGLTLLPIVVNEDSEDDRLNGELVWYMNVIQTGLLKFNERQKICCEPAVQFDSYNDEYIQFKG